MREYDFALGARAILFLQRLGKRERDLLLRTFERLAARPQQEPDGSLPTKPRALSYIHSGAFRIFYWVDHAECEVRVADITSRT
jgi:mRNA-degrading endonuclease RelE of RelBE toxin-antitoxin system